MALVPHEPAKRQLDASAAPLVRPRGGRSAEARASGSSAARCATRRSGAEVADLDLAVAGDPGAAAKAIAARARRARLRALRRVRAPGASVAARQRLAGRRDAAARRVDRGRPRRARLHRRRRRRAARRRRADRSLRRPRRPRAAAPARGRRAQLRRRTRCGCCGRPGSPPSLRPGDRSRHRRPRPRRRRARRRARPASASWPSCASCSAAPTRCAASPCSTSSELTAVVLPELEALRGVEQGPNHHLDVHGHTLAVLEHTLEVEADLGALRRRARRRRSRRCSPSRSPTRSSRGTALRFGALFHDIAKPRDRGRTRRLRRLPRPRPRSAPR